MSWCSMQHRTTGPYKHKAATAEILDHLPCLGGTCLLTPQVYDSPGFVSDPTTAPAAIANVTCVYCNMRKMVHSLTS